jgi:hypothetical protein
MATRRIFWGFCINRFGIGPLHYISSRSDFDFEFAEIFVIEKRLSDSPSRGVSDSPSFLLNIQKPTPRLAESASHRLPDSPSRRVADSPTHRVGESPARRIVEPGSHFSITNISANSKPKSERLER